MRKIIIVMVAALAAIFVMTGCGSQQYLGTYVYDHCNCSSTSSFVKDSVEEIADSLFDESMIFIEKDGVAYYGAGYKETEHSYVVDENYIIFTDCDLKYVYDKESDCLITKIDSGDNPMTLYYTRVESH